MAEGKKSPWKNKFSYLLSVIGFVIGLGNFWLFPTTCYQNGGAVFLIPYTFFLIFLGIPIVYLELLLGQVFRRANLGIYEEMCPWLKGSALTVIIMNIVRQMYYNTVLAWTLQLFFASFESPLPWASDVFGDKSTQVKDTLDGFYFVKTVLGKPNSTGINDLGGLQTSLLPTLVLVFVAVYIAIYDGATSIGSIVYVTAILPYVMLIVLLVKSATLDGAGAGMAALFSPSFEKLIQLKTWQNAAVQICYSLGPGSGVLIAYASYSDNREMDIKKYAILVVVCNGVTSLLCSFVLFCGLGHYTTMTTQSIDKLIGLGYAIIFVVYPMIIAKFAHGYIYSVIFFIMIFMVGLNSVYAELEGMYAAVADRFPSLNTGVAKKKLVIVVLCFLTSLPTVTLGGQFVVEFLLKYGIAPAVLIIVAIEAIMASWIYGYDRLVATVTQYSPINQPGKIMKYCWAFGIPLISMILYVANFFTVDGNKKTEFGNEAVTKKTQMIGEILNGLTLLPIPVYAMFWLTRRWYLKWRKKDSQEEGLEKTTEDMPNGV